MLRKNIFFLVELFNIIVLSYDIRQNNLKNCDDKSHVTDRTILERYIHFEMQNRLEQKDYHFITR